MLGLKCYKHAAHVVQFQWRRMTCQPEGGSFMSVGFGSQCNDIVAGRLDGASPGIVIVWMLQFQIHVLRERHVPCWRQMVTSDNLKMRRGQCRMRDWNFESGCADNRKTRKDHSYGSVAGQMLFGLWFNHWDLGSELFTCIRCLRSVGIAIAICCLHMVWQDMLQLKVWHGVFLLAWYFYRFGLRTSIS